MCASDQSNGAESTDILYIYIYKVALINENFNRFWKKIGNKKKNTDFVEILFSAFQSGDKEKETAPF